MSLRRAVRTACFVLLPVWISAWGLLSAAEPLIVDVSANSIAIEADFQGGTLLLFGAQSEPGEIIFIVTGPTKNMRVRKKRRFLGIWINGPGHFYENMPAYYAMFSSRELEADWLPLLIQQRHRIGYDALQTGEAVERLQDPWYRALIDSQVSQGFYHLSTSGLDRAGERLFRARLEFPARMDTGVYLVETLLVREGRVTSAQTLPIVAHREGISAFLEDLALEQGMLYGLLAILLALVGGFGADTLFRRYK